MTNALKSVRYVFGLLESESFTLFKDLHMQSKLLTFKRTDIDFIDLGTCLNNEDKSEKLYFIKMVHHNIATRKREVYILGF